MIAYLGDDFAPLRPRRAPRPIRPPAELARCLTRRPMRRKWRHCLNCGQHIERPARVCQTCISWSTLLRQLALIAGART
jgi:hypothetical protein